MKPEVLEHLLHSIPDSITKDGLAVDITPVGTGVLTLDREVFPYDPKYNGKTDFVLCVYDTDDNFESFLKKGKELLSPSGLFFLLVAGLESKEIIYTARKNGLIVSNSSIDREDGRKEHCFVFELLVEKENIVKQHKSVCTNSQPKCAVPHGSGLPDCCVAHLDELLTFVAKYFDDNKATYWLSDGTLLGAARDGKNIPWNGKATIAYLDSDKSKLTNLSKMCQLNGYYLLNDRIGKRLFYSRKNLICVHLTPWTIFGNRLTNRNETFDLTHIQPLVRLSLNGTDYNCPNNYEKILEQRYGADWQVPHNVNGKVSKK